MKRDAIIGCTLMMAAVAVSIHVLITQPEPNLLRGAGTMALVAAAWVFRIRYLRKRSQDKEDTIDKT